MRRFTPLAAALLLAGCGSAPKGPPEEPTLASLNARTPPRLADPGLQVTPEQTMAAYRRFLDVAVDVPQRAEALRRLGDLEMDSADRKAAQSAEATVPDYKAARARYEDFLKTYPKAGKRDRVLYQLARAQEQAGEIEAALKTLTQLTTEHPGTLHVGEAQFRRGEMLFAMRDYAQAEAAYAAVLRFERRGLVDPETAVASPLVERALYMQGWSFYKLNRLDEALACFFEVLDLKLADLPPIPREEVPVADIRQLSRADRELLEDTFRVLSLSLASLQGPATAARYIEGVSVPTPTAQRIRSGYQFRVYQHLAELYLKQDRTKDAADTLASFVRAQPLHPQAPAMLARVAQVYDERGFVQQALNSRREFVRRYGDGEDGQAFARAFPSIWRGAQQQVQDNLDTLARHHHAQFQKQRAAADAEEATRWYRQLLQQFPDAAAASERRFLLAELLFENRRWADAAAEYENVAAQPQAPSARRADAGYAALLAYAEQEKLAPADTPARAAIQRSAVASAARYAQAQPADARTAAVLVRAAEQWQELGDGERAAQVAQQALALQPAPADALRRAAWVVIAQHSRQRGQLVRAEEAYSQVLALTPATQPAHATVAEQLAATIYRQGEDARSRRQLQEAVGHFQRVAALSALGAQSAVRASAHFDAATALVELQDWPAASRSLEDFRRLHPGHALQAEVAPKLALAYEAQGRHSAAAAEFERIAAASRDAAIARSALWRAAELHGQAAAGAAPKSALLVTAIKAHERYLTQHPQPLDAAVQARWQLATLTRQDGQAARAVAWLKDVQQADASAGEARTPATRTLGGRAALLLAEPLAQAYRQVPLVEPLARQLKLKKAKFEDATRAYAEAAAVGITEVATAATLHTARLYQDFGQALLNAPRPKKLNKTEQEQYAVMLEEQAYPFEEQAIALHEGNARRAAGGVYDEAVRASYAELARLKPARWGKVERGDASLPAALPAIEAALKASPKDALLLNQLGIAQRQQGRFDEARRAYEAAMAQDTRATEPPLNLAILYDLYLGDAARATTLYQRCLELSPADAPTLNKWLAELKTRKPAAAAAPAADSTVATTRKEPT